MGKFGSLVGDQLIANGNEVMVVDKDEDRIEQFSSKYTHAVSANCMNYENLKSFNIPSFDACIVAIGDDFQSSLEVTSQLKDLGAKYVISKASTEIQKKFLLKNGADEVVYPYQDSAEKLAVMVNSRKIYDYFALNDSHSIFELEVPSDWIDKSILEINPRKKFQINVLMVNRNEEIISSIDAEFIFKQGDHVVVFGETDKLMTFTNKKVK